MPISVHPNIQSTFESKNGSCMVATMVATSSSLLTRKLCYRKDDRARIARYVSRSWAVAEIWPFEIIQDGGGRYLEFVRIENSAIRFAVPENRTL